MAKMPPMIGGLVNIISQLPPCAWCALHQRQRDFVGFVAKSILARQIIDGQSPVSFLGDDIPVRATIHTINGFSAHANQAELLKWHRHTGAGRTFLTHEEQDTMQTFASRLSKTQVEMPKDAAAPSAFTVSFGG